MELDEKLENNEEEIAKQEKLIDYFLEAKPDNTEEHLYHSQELTKLYKERCRLLAELAPI